jgi:tRNA A-37 threonylcarbamoyl transferase component Bud32
MGNKESQNNSKLKREYKTLININGDKYEGEILNEERSGYGINYYKNGNKYEGWWENDLENGTGSLFYKDGSLYIGQWANGKQNGMGTLYYNLGDKYYGNFIDGKKNGKGLFISRNNNNRFIGTFKNNLKHGKGIMYYHQNKKLSKEIWDNGILVSSQIISFEENEGNENTIKLFSKQNLLLMGFFSGNLNNETNENEKNKNFTLSVAKYFKARIPNNYFDAMNLIIYTSDLLYNNNKIFEWSERNIITWMNRIGIEKNKYKDIIIKYGINGIKFLQFTGNELINYNIVDVRDTKLILKSIDFLRIFVRLFTDYSEKYELNSHENNFTREIMEANYVRTGNRHATMNQMFTSNRNDENELRRVSSNYNIYERNNNLINTNKNSLNENNSTIYTSVNNNRSRRSSIRLSNPNNQNYNNIIENVEFTLTKISLTKLLMNSLSLGGFNFYIPFNELKIIKKIGEGAFGEVFLGYWNEKKVAIKKFFFVKKYHERVHQNKINKNLNLKPILIKFIKEINIIGNLRHPNLVLYMGASISNNNNCYLVMEYVDNGNLFNFLHRGKYNKEGNYQKFDLNLTTKIALEIALAIKYLHCRNITHCDLKSINVLLDHNYHVKITDFGVSKIINILYEKGQEIKGKLGTTHWMPPEIMKSYKYEEKSDVFSYGMILYEIITGDIPYYGLFPNQIVGLVADCRKIVQVPEITSNPYLRKIVVECLKYDIDDRPSFEEIIYYLEKVISFLDKRDFDFEDICKFVI